MAPDVSPGKGSAQIRFGNPGRLLPETRQLTLVVLGHVIVFLLAMGHDEIVAEMVEDGLFIAQYAERFELLLGFGLFLCWSALTLRLVAILQQAKAHNDVCAKCGHDALK